MATEPPTRPALRGIERPPASATRPRVVIDDLIHLIRRLQLTANATVPKLPTLLAALTVCAHQLLCLRARLRASLRPRLRRIRRRRLGTRTGVEPEQLARLARLRWMIELDYKQLKGELGLDHYEGRSYAGFHHHCALVTAAHGFLTLERADPNRPRPA